MFDKSKAKLTQLQEAPKQAITIAIMALFTAAFALLVTMLRGK